MKITKHAQERLAERFGIKSDSDLKKLERKFERDFIRHKSTPEGKVFKTVVWKDSYLTAVFENDLLITVVNKGWIETHFLHKKNPVLQQGKNRRGKRGRKDKYA